MRRVDDADDAAASIASRGVGRAELFVTVFIVSVQWTGYIQPPSNGPYFFKTNSSGSVQVWINGQLVIDNDHPGNSETPWPRGYSYGIYMDAGETVPIKIQYIANPGSAQMQLLWRLGAYAETGQPEPKGDLVNNAPSGYTPLPLNVYTTSKTFRECAAP